MRPLKIFTATVILIFIASSLQAQWQYLNNNAYYNDGNVGIGLSTPAEKFAVAGDNTIIELVNNGGRTVGYTLTYKFAISGHDQNGVGGMSAVNTGGVNGVHDLRFSLWDGVSQMPERLSIQGSTGNVGIGTINPTSKLQIRTGSNFNVHFSNNTIASSITAVNDAGTDNVPMQFQATDLRFLTNLSGTGSSESMRLSTNGGLALGNAYVGIDPGAGNMIISGNVGVGTNDTKGYRFAVNGDAIFTKVKVKLFTNWPDFVFHNNYRLRPLSEVEQYIQQYSHLPEVPSAAEVEKDGLDLGDNQATLLKKIEELTLYMIEQNKQQVNQNEKLQQLLERVQQLENENKELKQLTRKKSN